MDETATSPIQLRQATLEDVPHLADLNRQLQEDELTSERMTVNALATRLEGWLRQDYRACWFETEDDPVAYAVYRSSDDGLYMRQFFVLREHRRRGVGRAAMQLFRDQMIPPEQFLSLEAYTHNARAIAFYRAIGFQEHTISFRISGPSTGRTEIHT